MFLSDVNSPMKPLSQSKDNANQAAGPNGRKASVSRASGDPFSVSSPTSTRPATRRRESIEPNPFSGGLSSPTSAGRFNRDESTSWFGRKAADLKETDVDEAEDQQPSG